MARTMGTAQGASAPPIRAAAIVAIADRCRLGIPPRNSAQRAASRFIELVQRYPQSTRFLFEHQMVSVRGKPEPALRPSRRSWRG
ncbi:hypothetical protein HNP40_002518 [Mycobacteroides chelonae]|nr:hypothetical protein [Mycobacteroides chelonae]